jgi:hypothetical protein
MNIEKNSPTLAQQQLKRRLSFSLSLAPVGPLLPNAPADVPLIEITTVELSGVAKT